MSYSERELADMVATKLNDEIESLRAKLAGFEALIATLCAEHALRDIAIADCGRNLREQEAQLAMCVEVLSKYADMTHWGSLDPSGCPKGMGRYTEYCELGPTTASELIASLPFSAKANAEVLRAAREVADEWEQGVAPSVEQFRTLCLALRKVEGEKG